MFEIKFWHTGLAQGLSAIFAIFAVYLMNTGEASWYWLLAWAFTHFYLTGTGSLGAHRYFCHGAFKTTKFREYWMAISTLHLWIGSDIQWGTGHDAHHEFCDTEDDPHNAKTIRGFFLGRYVKPKGGYKFRFVKPLVKDKVHVWLHRHAVLIPLITCSILGTIDYFLGTYFLLIGYLAPLFTSLTSGAIHNVLSHEFGEGPRDMPCYLLVPPVVAIMIGLGTWYTGQVFWLNFLIPTMMMFMPFEWAHGSHHEDPRNANMAFKHKWLPDPGYWLVNLIRTDKKVTT
jgi:fatty-acid desaturase